MKPSKSTKFGFALGSWPHLHSASYGFPSVPNLVFVLGCVRGVFVAILFSDSVCFQHYPLVYDKPCLTAPPDAHVKVTTRVPEALVLGLGYTGPGFICRAGSGFIGRVAFCSEPFPAFVLWLTLTYPPLQYVGRLVSPPTRLRSFCHGKWWKDLPFRHPIHQLTRSSPDTPRFYS